MKFSASSNNNKSFFYPLSRPITILLYSWDRPYGYRISLTATPIFLLHMFLHLNSPSQN